MTLRGAEAPRFHGIPLFRGSFSQPLEFVPSLFSPRENERLHLSSLTFGNIARPTFREKLHAKSFAAAIVCDLPSCAGPGA